MNLEAENLNVQPVIQLLTDAFDQTELAEIPLKAEQEYIRWKNELAKLGYTWKAYEATTDDGYVLTLFRITGTESGGNFTPDKDPVLI